MNEIIIIIIKINSSIRSAESEPFTETKNKKKRLHKRVTFLQSLKQPRLHSIRGFKMMSKPDYRDAEQPRAAPISSRWHPCAHCSDARAQLISNVKGMKLHRTGLWDMQGRLGVHANDTVMRSCRVGEKTV